MSWLLLTIHKPLSEDGAVIVCHRLVNADYAETIGYEANSDSFVVFGHKGVVDIKEFSTAEFAAKELRKAVWGDEAPEESRKSEG